MSSTDFLISVAPSHSKVHLAIMALETGTIIKSLRNSHRSDTSPQLIRSSRLNAVGLAGNATRTAKLRASGTPFFFGSGEKFISNFIRGSTFSKCVRITAWVSVQVSVFPLEIPRLRLGLGRNPDTPPAIVTVVEAPC